MFAERKNRPSYQIQLPIASLIDIVFLLLIYFLLTTNFLVNEGIKIKLPQASSAAPQVQQEITVYVDVTGNAFLQNKKIPDESLFIELKKMIGESKNKMVVVKADRAVVLNKAVKIMDMAKAAGAARLCLATEKN